MEVTVKALTSFLGSEGMWRQGDTKKVSKSRAHELLQENLIAEVGEGEEAEEAPAPRPRRKKPGADRETKEDGPAPETK